MNYTLYLFFEGQTVKKGSKLVIHWHKKMDMGMAYVMLGRCENINDVYIAGEFKVEGIKASPIALEESKFLKKSYESHQAERLEEESKHFVIAYLNVWSLKGHLDYVKKEKSLMNSDTFGLGETWLKIGETVALDSFECNFANAGRGKGCASYTKEVSKETLCHVSETLSAICLRGTRFDIIFMYLSQNFEQSKAFALLKDWIIVTNPTIVMGDMNWNYGENHNMKEFMKQLNFTQLITKVTHDKGHILDHVYVNKHIIEMGCHVTQESVHFSDHDLVKLFVNKN